MGTSKGLFTVSFCVCDCDVANKWIPLISMELFTSSDAKHQRKRSNTNANAQCEWALSSYSHWRVETPKGWAFTRFVYSWQIVCWIKYISGFILTGSTQEWNLQVTVRDVQTSSAGITDENIRRNQTCWQSRVRV